MQLETFLQERGVTFDEDRHAATYTAQGLAHEEHVSGYMVAKPVVVKGAKGFTMCVLPAPKRLDLARVAEVLGDDSVRLATEPEMAEIFPDCELGAEPPVGALFGLETVMDSALRDDARLVMQAGSHTRAISMDRKDWERVCQPRVAPIALT